MFANLCEVDLLTAFPSWSCIVAVVHLYACSSAGKTLQMRMEGFFFYFTVFHLLSLRLIINKIMRKTRFLLSDDVHDSHASEFSTDLNTNCSYAYQYELQKLLSDHTRRRFTLHKSENVAVVYSVSQARKNK